MKIRSSAKVLFALGFFIVIYNFSYAGNPSLSLWTKKATSALSQQRSWYPEHYSLFSLEPSVMKNYLSQAPVEAGMASGNSTDFIISLPLPDGSFHSYTLVESPVMEAPLAAAYPDIKTYAGQGIDDPTATIRCDVTVFGFHAYVISATGVLYIDPLVQGQTAEYIVYYKKDIPAGLYNLNCLLAASEEKNLLNPVEQRIYQPSAVVSSIGNQLRTYRLALAATGEYTAFYGGTVSQALAGMVTTMNRVNGIYERELDIHMNLVANDTVLIFTNSVTDPFSNNNANNMLNQNQATCDNLIGSANYDIGHVFSTGGGGLSGLGVVCNNASKARGVTGSSTPVGDPYDVDYVAHEMGHEFGADHTFNSVTSSCGSGNRTASDAYEPGSGSTIMAYAGICGSDDLQNNSDAYFHTKSFDEIVTYTQAGAGNSCAAVTVTVNNWPTVNLPPVTAYTIPDQTPFRLTATGSDPDGDPITFCWEEYDLGPSCPWNMPTGDAPIFRSFNPTVSGTRLFPKLSNILANSVSVGEIKPSYDRTLHFRCTVRDNKAGCGGVTHSTNTEIVSVIDAGTGFAITSPNTTGITWAGLSTQTVTWDVSGSNISPISTPNVNIYLSTNGGSTFTDTIAMNVPNNGSYSFIVPNKATTTARIMVEGAGNIFFDINDKSFIITFTIGIEEHDINSQINLYPNPASGNFHFVVNTTVAGICSIRLLDVTGRTVKEFSIMKNYTFIDQAIDLSGISSGLYLVRFETPEGVAERKLIIE